MLDHVLRALAAILGLALLPSASSHGQTSVIDLPTPQEPTWGREPVVTDSPARAHIVLNGLWRFRPSADISDFGPASSERKDWGLLWVPGDWRPAYNWPRWGVLPGPQDFGPVKWEHTLMQGVYARPLTIPTDWAGRAIFLDCRRLSTDAVVWLDGKKLGSLAFPGGEFDLTPHVKPGYTHELRLLVVADGSGQTVLYLEGTMGDTKAAAKPVQINHRGLVDDVILVSRPAGPRVADLFVRPSVREKRLSLDLKFQNPPASGELTLDFTVRPSSAAPDSAPAKTWSRTVPAAAFAAPLSVDLPWADPVLWDTENPHLYDLSVTLSPASAKSPKTSAPAAATPTFDVFTQRFGFREFWIESRHFILNGAPIRLRPAEFLAQFKAPVTADYKWGEGGFHTAATLEGYLRGKKRLGFNLVETWPGGPLDRSRVLYHDQLHEIADRLGLLVMSELPSMVPLAKDKLWEDPAKRAVWESETASWIRRQRNHPSIIAWVHSPNYFGQNSLTSDPAAVGQRALMELANVTYQETAVPGRAANAFIKSLDPTRPVTTHHGATVGDFLAVNTYLNFTPLQEREDWWSDYAAKADLPFMAIEFEFALSYSFQHARWLARNGGNGERFDTEYLAAQMGEVAYATEPAALREGHVTHWQGKPQSWLNSHHYYGKGDWDLWTTFPAYGDYMRDTVTRSLRALRTWGVDGGAIPWELAALFRHDQPADARLDFGPFVPGTRGVYRPSAPLAGLDGLPPDGAGQPYGFAAALQPWLRPAFAWIAGGPDRFTRKDSRFFSGERIEKQLALVNDRLVPLAFDLRLSASAADYQKSFKGTLQPGEIRFLPVAFTAPFAALQRLEGELVLSGTLGTEPQSDRFAFSVWPRPSTAPTKSAAAPLLFDPSGRTSAMLEKLGVTTEPWDGVTRFEPAGRIVIIGQNALRQQADLLTLLSRIARAGARVLVSRQHPDWLRDGPEFRVASIVSREAFPVRPDHPVLAGLSAADLRDWRGESTLPPPTATSPAPSRLSNSPGEEPMHYRRWGTLGAVSSAPVEKPHVSGWRPILHCEFDLAYTPLMELDLGSGRIVWSTLDLEDNVGLDPAATRLAANLLHYLASPLPPRDSSPVRLLASADWQTRLAALGLRFVPTSRVPSPGTPGLLLLDSAAKPNTIDLDAFLQAGGTVAVLPASAPTSALGLGLTRDRRFIGAESVPEWPPAAGLSRGDLRLRTAFPTWLANADTSAFGTTVAAGGLLARRSSGAGNIFWLQLDPWSLDVEKIPALRTSRWRLTRAFCQVLANLGGEFAADQAAFDPTARNRLWLRSDWRAALTSRHEASETPRPDTGFTETATPAVAPDFDDSAWLATAVPHPYHRPGYMEYLGGEWIDADGEAVFRREVFVPAAWAGRDLVLNLGRIVQTDVTFFNGERVGAQQSGAVPRNYRIPGNLVQAGRNVLAVRVWNERGRGGLIGNPGADWPGEKSLVIDDSLWLAPADTTPGRFLGLYHPDYRNDHGWGDDPYRYWKW